MNLFNTFTLTQWALMFYIYCFIGWVWECCYVSAKEKRFTNRGFLHGPLLPIYGSGAIVMLFATLPVRNNIVLVFIVSAVSATILEYIIGASMLHIFKVRYWDYSYRKFNLHGHICLFASTGWGIAGVILVFFVGKPIEHFVLSIPTKTAELLAIAITVATSCDLGASFRDAMDVRELIIRMAEEAERRKDRIEKRVDVALAFYGDDLKHKAEEITDAVDDISEFVEDIRTSGMEKLEEIKESGIEKLEEIKESGMEKFEALTRRQRRRLVRFIKANPYTDSNIMKISEILEEIKEYIKSAEGNGNGN